MPFREILVEDLLFLRQKRWPLHHAAKANLVAFRKHKTCSSYVWSYIMLLEHWYWPKTSTKQERGANFIPGCQLSSPEARIKTELWTLFQFQDFPWDRWAEGWSWPPWWITSWSWRKSGSGSCTLSSTSSSSWSQIWHQVTLYLNFLNKFIFKNYILIIYFNAHAFIFQRHLPT
jgi:hypothetical protein